MTEANHLDQEYVLVEDIEFNEFGWKKDLPDERDYQFSFSSKDLPRNFSLKPHMPKVLDQGQLGSCTANGICNALRRCEIVEGIDDEKPRSRLFVYYNEREMEGNVNEDAGAQIRDGIKSVANVGSCFESTWPYDIKLFTEKPPPEAYAEAKLHKAIQYHRVGQEAESLKHAIYSGFPVVFGFVVYSSIRKPTVIRSGIIPMPTRFDQPIGGHCVVLTGWDDTRRLFQIQNSWGEKFGDEGYGYMSYDYILNPELASDFWLITYVK